MGYPEFLNIRPYMSQSSGEPVMYGLYAVLVHSGYSCHAGHYYCYVKVRGSGGGVRRPRGGGVCAASWPAGEERQVGGACLHSSRWALIKLWEEALFCGYVQVLLLLLLGAQRHPSDLSHSVRSHF